jgi:hypothetical protein
MRAIQEPKGLPLRLPFAPDKNFNYVYDLRIRNITSDAYNSRTEVELTEDNFPFDKAVSDGTDIAFRDDKGVTLNHSIVNWGNGSAKVNVVLDDIYNRDLRSLQMFYGKLPFPLPGPTLPPLSRTAVVRATQHAEQVGIWSLIVFNNKLYGTSSQSGLLLEWNGTDAWITKASYLPEEYLVNRSVIHNNKLYCGGCGHVILAASLLEWNGTDTWSRVASLTSAHPDQGTFFLSMCGFDNKLYTTGALLGRLYEWDDVDTLVYKDAIGYATDESGLNTLVNFDDKMYGCGYDYGVLYEWDGIDYGGGARLIPKTPAMVDHGGALVVFRNRLYKINILDGRLYQWDGIDTWVGPKTPPLSTRVPATGGVVFGDYIFVLDVYGKLYAWNNLNAWNLVAYCPTGETSVQSLCVYDGRLFGGTYPHGQLVEYIAT